MNQPITDIGTHCPTVVAQEFRETKNLPRLLLRDSCRGDRIRTCDPLVPNQMRYQLRYTPNNGHCQKNSLVSPNAVTVTYGTLFFQVVGVTGFEPATPWSQTRCATNCATPRKLQFLLLNNLQLLEDWHHCLNCPVNMLLCMGCHE